MDDSTDRPFLAQPTPARLWGRIKKALEKEAEIPSLPATPKDSSSFEPSKSLNRPADLYDVGIQEASNNTTVLPQTHRIGSTSHHHTSQSNPLSTRNRPERSNPQPTNTDHPQFTTNSPITSTPAPPHANHHRPSSGYPTKYSSTRSPDTSHIPQNQEAHQNREHMVILSSGSGTDNDHPEPDILEEDDSDDSDHAHNHPQNNSLGQLNLSVLDDYASELDINPQSSTIHPNRHQLPHLHTNSTALPHSCPSPSSSSQSTLMANSPKNASPRHDPGIHQHSHQLAISQLSSPGNGRRDSSRIEHSLSIDDISHSLSQEPAPEISNIKKSTIEPSPIFQPESISTPSIRYRRNHQSRLTGHPSTRFPRLRGVLNSNIKPAQSVLPPRSARRPFVPKHLSDITHDTSDLDQFADNQSNQSDNSPPSRSAESGNDETSHDLTTYPGNRHQNGNSSFSFGDRSQRFNGNKLNSYLHVLNGQLTTENTHLVTTLAEVKGQLEQLQTEFHLLRTGSQNHASSHDSNTSELLNLSNAVINDLGGALQAHYESAPSKFPSVEGEAFVTPSESSNQTILLQRQIKLLENQIQQRDEEVKELREQLCQKHPFKPLQQTFELKEHLHNAQKQLAIQEEKALKLKLEQLEISGQHASTVADLQAQCEQLEASLYQAQEALATARIEANNDKAEFDAKYSSLKSHCKAMVDGQDEQLKSISSKWKEARRLVNAQAKELADLKANQPTARHDSATLMTVKTELQELLDGRVGQTVSPLIERRLRLLKSKIEGLISDTALTSQDRSSSPNPSAEIVQLQYKLEESCSQVDALKNESLEKAHQVQMLEQALEDSEGARTIVEGQLADLQTQLDILEPKLVAQQSTIKGLEAKLSQVLKSAFSDVSSLSSHLIPKSDHSAYNPELVKAQQEITRLQGLLEKFGDPAAFEIQNVKIAAMEAQRLRLEDRVGSLRQQASALMSTPSRSSLHFQSVISMRTPKTPGQILGNMTSILGGDSGDETIVPMLNQIHDLQQQVEQLRHQLDLANKSVDQKLTQLAEAGENALKVSSDAIAAQKKVEELEDQCQQLEQRLEKLIGNDGIIEQVKHRLSNVGCPECGQRFDANEVVRFRVVPETQELEFTAQFTENDTEEHSVGLKVKFSELEVSHKASQNENIKLKRELDLKNDQIDQLESDKETYKREIQQLLSQLSGAQDEVESLQNRLKKERDSLEKIEKQLRSATADKQDFENQLETVNCKLQETEAQLLQVTEARDSMDAEIRALHKSKEDSEALSVQINQLQTTISKLEEEKAAIAEQEDSLAEEISRLKRELDRKNQLVFNSEKSYHRVQTTLEKQNQDLNRLKDELEDKLKLIEDLNGQKDDLLLDTKDLRKELVKVRSEAQDLGRDFQLLRDRFDYHPVTTTKEMTRVKDELFLCKKELARYQSEKNHQSNDRLSSETRATIDQKHNSECKGLLLRIRFLKVLFTRESTFRADLVFQKRLILNKLRDTELRHQAIQLALSQFGLPYSLSSIVHFKNKPGDKNLKDRSENNFTLNSTEFNNVANDNKKTFKSIALVIRAICKLKILSKSWNKEVRSKEKLKEAYFEVRGKEFISD